MAVIVRHESYLVEPRKLDERAREAALQAAGYRVEVIASDVTETPAAVLQRIRQVMG